MIDDFKVGVVQFDIKKGDTQTNLENAFKYLTLLSQVNVSLAVLPEMFSSSFDNDNLQEHGSEFESIIKRFSEFALKNKIAVAGTLPELVNNSIYNTMVFIDTDGNLKAKYKKIHLFKLTGEHHYYSAGNQTIVVDSNLGKIGLMTCYDLRFPEVARSLFLKGANMIVVSAQWPTPRRDHWEKLFFARAIENQLYMVGSNRTGTEDGLDFPGTSMIVNPAGELIADAGSDSGNAVADIHLNAVKDFRNLIPCKSDRRPDAYK